MINHLYKIIIVGVLTLILFTASVSALDINISQKTDTSLLLTFTPALSNISHTPEVWLNNQLIETPIKDKLLLDNLKPDTEYYISIYFSQPDSVYYPDYHQIITKTEPSSHIQVETAISTYGYILLILLVLIGIALVKLPFGGFIPLFLALAGVVQYIKYSSDDPTTVIIYIVLIIISVYIIYIKEAK